MFKTSDLKWTREPKKYDISEDSITIVTEPGDKWLEHK